MAMSLESAPNDVMMPVRSIFSLAPQRAGAFEIEKIGDESVRLVMREPHFANNVRYMLVVERSRGGVLLSHWKDSEDQRPCSWLEVGIA